VFIFLDFDGVLHTHHGHTSALWTYLPRFESVLRDYEDARVVVSSSWGDGRSVEELRAFFSPDIQPRITDKVQNVRYRLHGDGDRARACIRWCRRHRLRAGDWIALDDNSQLFRPSTPLILCMNGFREDEELQLRMALADEIPAWRFALETVSSLYSLELNRNAKRTRDYVLEHRPDVGDGRTLSQLLFARQRRTVEQHLQLLDALRPPQPLLTDEEIGELYGGPRYEMVDGVSCLVPRREKK
jgi:hypothetical protein